MMLKSYKGGCHCGRVRFEADIDLDAGAGKCNCSICTKRRTWSVIIKPEAFRLVSSPSALSDYQFGTMSVHHRFCSSCGVGAFGEGHVEAIGGAYVAVSVNCLDDVDPTELAELPVRYMDGRNNSWFETPKETRHL